MANLSALNIIRRLNTEIPYSVKKGEEFVETLAFLNRELSFATFAIAKAGPNGDLPKDQYFPTKTFPVFDPRTLEESLRMRQTTIEPLNNVLIVPCIHENQFVGVLFAHSLQGKWSSREVLLVELASTELGRLLVSSIPGLTVNPNLKNKSKMFKNSAPRMIGKSEKLNQISSMIARVAPTTASVLVLGESGTGKEIIARQIHALSERSEYPFVAINCGAITESLLESELFGHEKGSFTGASATKKGLVEVANGGTLFLDEIGEMSILLQAKLLRFLQEGEFYRVGGKEPLQVSVRIISATNRDLENEVRIGRFREDVYYRLNTISIKSPALRDRKDDIALLIEFFAPGTLDILTREALECLKDYSWPGNIRELQNVVERLRILASGKTIEAHDLPQNIRQTRLKAADAHLLDAPPIDMPLEDLERIHILRCLTHHEGNKTRTAQSLGITIKTLYNKLHRYGVLERVEANL